MATLTTLNAASPLDASDNTYLTFTVDTTETLSRALDNVDADFLTMNTLTFNVEYSVTAAVSDDTYDLSIRIVNGTTILAAADAGGTAQTVATNITSTTDVTSGATSFSYVNQTASKTDWDGASVELTQTYTKSKGGDGVAIQVDQVIFDGDYDGQIILTADQQTYTLTGVANTLTRSLVLTADAQSYTLTGIDANPAASLNFTADLQTYTLTGQALSFDYSFAAQTGSFSLTGVDATFDRAEIIVADQQSYTLTGVDANFTTATTLTAEAGSFTLTGNAAQFVDNSLLYLRPDADTSIGSWTDQNGGTTNIYTTIDETAPANDSDYVKSEAGPSASVAKFGLSNPTGTVDTSGAHTVKYRYRKGNANGQAINLTVRLVENTTTIATWNHNNITASFVDATQTLSAGEISSIGNYDNLFIEFEANAP